MSGLRQLASVEHFHEQRHRAANRALAGLPFTDCAEVADAQTVSKAGLSEAGPLADLLESGGVHLASRSASDARASSASRKRSGGRTATARMARAKLPICAFQYTSTRIVVSFDGCREVLGGRHGRVRAGNPCIAVLKRKGAASPERDAAGCVEDTKSLGVALGAIIAANGDDVVAEHGHSPVSGGAWPRVDELHIGPMGRCVNRKNAPGAIIFGGHA